MKKYIIAAVLFLIIGLVNIQSQVAYESYNIKEYYDYIDVKNLALDRGFPGYIDGNSNSAGTDGMANQLSERLNDVTNSYIRMYQATGDKAYLIKFINWSIKVQSVRLDNLNSTLRPGWVPLTSIYREGRILAPMAEFAYRIKNTPDLSSIAIPQQLIDIPTNFTSQIGSAQLTNYGQFADWLMSRVLQTIDWYNSNFFFNSGTAYREEGAQEALEINMQSTFGSTLIYAGLYDPVQVSNPILIGYRGKANIIASKYKSFINITDKCDQVFPSCVPNEYHNPVLAYNSISDCYSWFSAGWQIAFRNCLSQCGPHLSQPNFLDYTDFIEDISHGAATLKFPIAMNEIYYGQFYDEDLVRFRNTFTKKIWDPSQNGFHFNVRGDELNAPIALLTSCSGQLFNCAADVAMTYMPLYIFDGYSINGNPTTATAPNVYNIIMDYYTTHFHGASTSYSGLADLGISEIVKAQWAKECVNLTLYNRDLVYDQDFNVRNNLTLAPNAVTDPF